MLQNLAAGSFVSSESEILAGMATGEAPVRACVCKCAFVYACVCECARVLACVEAVDYRIIFEVLMCTLLILCSPLSYGAIEMTAVTGSSSSSSSSNVCSPTCTWGVCVWSGACVPVTIL